MIIKRPSSDVSNVIESEARTVIRSYLKDNEIKQVYITPSCEHVNFMTRLKR